MATNDTKRIPAIATEIASGQLVITFATGEQFVIEPTQLSKAVAEQALLHGLKQKLVDAAAISRNPETGRSATVADKRDAVKKVYDRLMSGEWNAAKGDGTGSGGLLFRALCELYPNRTPETLREYHDALTKEQQAALRTNPKVAPIIARLRDERTPKAKGIDSDALLGGLEG